MNLYSASVIWLHGLGADGTDFVDVVPMLGLPDELAVRFIMPHAPLRPVTINAGMTMPAWYDLYALDRLDQQDTAGIAESTTTVNALIDAQIAQGIASERIVLIGFSQGGAIALYAGLTCAHQLAGVAGLSTYLPIASEFTGDAQPANAQTPILLQHGEQDQVVPYTLGQQSCDILKKQARPVSWQSYSMGHHVCAPQMTDLGLWLSERFA